MKELESFLQEHFSETDFVYKPEHPLLLRGPDALVSGPGNLCAFFVPNGWEIDNPAHLATRLISSRLALPEHCRTVLLVDGAEGAFFPLERDFGLFTSLDDSALTKFIGDSSDFGAARRMERKIQAGVLKTYDTALTLTEQSYRITRTKRSSSPPELSRRVHSNNKSSTLESGVLKYSPRNRIEIEGRPMSFLSGKNRNNVIQQLMFAASGAILERYTLDTGIPYPKEKPVHLAISSVAAEAIDMRGKYAHGAAFSGTSLIPTDDLETIQSVIESNKYASESV